MRVFPKELRLSLKNLYEQGLPAGEKTGWPSLDKHYTVSPGQWTLITGMPGHGKSEWLDALMVNMAEKRGWHFEVFSPENAPVHFHLSKLLEKYQGKPFGAGPVDRMTDEELTEGLDFLNEHFRFHKFDRPVGIHELLVETAGLCPSGCSGIVIDPWNQAEHLRPSNMREDEYISMVLSDVIHVAREKQIHIFIVAHPAKMQKENGRRPVPTPYDVAGGAHWFNKADNIITVYRDVENHAGEVDIHVQKVRFKWNGRPGLVTLRYDRTTGKYYEILRDVADMKARGSGDSIL